MKTKGFTLIDTILAMCIASFCIMLMTTMVQTIAKIEIDDEAIQEKASIHQMRLIYALSKDFYLDGDMLAFTYQEKDFYYSFYEDKLLLNDGYQVFLNDLQEVYFSEKNSCYYLTYTKDMIEYEKVIIGC